MYRIAANTTISIEGTSSVRFQPKSATSLASILAENLSVPAEPVEDGGAALLSELERKGTVAAPMNGKPELLAGIVDPELLRYWRTLPRHSNEFLACDLIEQLLSALDRSPERPVRTDAKWTPL
jgi:hypothetical protein